MSGTIDINDMQQLRERIEQQAHRLGFQQLGVAHTNLEQAEKELQQWLAAGYHGEMEWMASHGNKRSRPGELVPGTKTIISVRMNYLPEQQQRISDLLDDPLRAFISRYALGRDYHKLLRKRLQKLADFIHSQVGDFGYRVFVDSAPVMERQIAEMAGLGWIGKHTLLINEQAGSWFFLGEIYTDLPLPVDQAGADHCGTCQNCIDICPTQAIIDNRVVDARRCISYLTIELKGSIPVDLRPLMGNRIYGCDDCQLVCPWNRFAEVTDENDFMVRHSLDDISLIELFNWDEQTFLANTEGSAIRRIGHERWLRNIAVALGNAKYSPDICRALEARQEYLSALVGEHVYWALTQQEAKRC